jgi:hypothetical protein
MSDLRSPSDPSLWSASKFACPACGFQLRRYDGVGRTLLWCDRGKCPSFKANDGATGPDEDRAYAELVVNCEAEGWDEP